MSFDLGEILAKMGPAALAVVSVLGIMALYTLTVFFERLWTFQKVRASSSRFAAAATRHLQQGQHAELARVARADKANYLGEMIANGLDTYVAARKDPSPDVS